MKETRLENDPRKTCRLSGPGPFSERGALSSQHVFLCAAACGCNKFRNLAPGRPHSTANPTFLKMNLKNFSDNASFPVNHTCLQEHEVEERGQGRLRNSSIFVPVDGLISLTHLAVIWAPTHTKGSCCWLQGRWVQTELRLQSGWNVQVYYLDSQGELAGVFPSWQLILWWGVGRTVGMGWEFCKEAPPQENFKEKSIPPSLSDIFFLHLIWSPGFWCFCFSV